MVRWFLWPVAVEAVAVTVTQLVQVLQVPRVRVEVAVQTVALDPVLAAATAAAVAAAVAAGLAAAAVACMGLMANMPDMVETADQVPHPDQPHLLLLMFRLVIQQ